MKKFNITVNGSLYQVEVEEITEGKTAPASQAAPVSQPVPSPAPAPVAGPKPSPAPAAKPVSGKTGAVKISCPMPGTIVKILVKPGQSVKRGEILFLLEAMKMENELVSPQDAVVATVDINQGASVNAGDLLATLN